MNDFLFYESAQARSERTIKKLIIVIILSIILLFASNAIWLYCWMQYDYVSEEITYTQDSNGVNNINTGVIQGDLVNEPEAND